MPNLRIRNQTKDTTEIYLYDSIGCDGFFSTGIDAIDVVKQINAIAAKRIDLRINSDGGDVFEGLTIYNALLRHPAEVHSYIDGLAASIASVIALAGKTVSIAPNAFYMIHNPWMVAAGDAALFRDLAERMDKVAGNMATIYQAKTKATSEQVTQWMNAETWFTADEATTAGFADGIDAEALPIAACLRHPQAFKHLPKQFHASADAKPNYNQRIATMHRQATVAPNHTLGGTSNATQSRRTPLRNGGNYRTESGHHGAGGNPKPRLDARRDARV